MHQSFVTIAEEGGGGGGSRANECAVFLTYPLSLCVGKYRGFDIPRQTWQCNVITD